MAAEKSGAGAVVIVGIEGAGHKNPTQVTTLINMPLAVRNIRIPVIAAGGIGDARGFMAALAMGAEAAYLGTVFIATDECPASARYKLFVIARQYDARQHRRLAGVELDDELLADMRVHLVAVRETNHPAHSATCGL